MIFTDNSIFEATDAAIKAAKDSKDPITVADSNGIMVGAPLSGSIVGMATRFSYLGIIAVNRRLDEMWRMFALWHEIAHILRNHVDDPAFNNHSDYGIFTQSFDSRTISRHEREANLISAEYNIDTESVLDMIGYHNRTMQDYRKLKKYQDQLVQAYDNLRFSVRRDNLSNSIKYRMAEYRRTLQELDEKRYDLESDLSAMNCVYSISEIASNLGTNEVILKYKFEAMRIRGYDIDVQELEQYNKVFRNAR